MVGYALQHPIRTTVIVVGGIVLGAVGFFVSQIWLTFEAVATDDFNPMGASVAMLQRSPDEIRDAAARLAAAERLLIDQAAAQRSRRS